MYPTFAKLAAAILFAALAWRIGETTLPRVPQGLRTDQFLPVTAGLAAVVGWRIPGRHARTGLVRAMAFGMSAGIVIALASSLLWAFWEAMRRALRGRYDDPMVALEAVIELAVGYLSLLRLDTEVPLLLLGSAAAGLATAFVAKLERG